MLRGSDTILLPRLAFMNGNCLQAKAFVFYRKKREADGVILLSEYHASSIRLWRVILLRSDIRLAPSDIRFASFRANRISLEPQGFNITIALAIIPLRRSRNITLAFSADL